ncbi:unnamed protein product [Rhizopus stolonifer]
MDIIEGFINNKKTTATSFALLGASALFVYYNYYSENISLLERLYFRICTRDVNEALFEHELVIEKEPDIIAENTQFVDINGRRLRIVHIIHELGSRVPLIVFIHGLGGQVSQWQHQIEYFSQTAHILAIDLLGCGKSEVVNDWDAYTTEALVESVKELLTDRYKHPNTVIIAHSYGCSIASFVAACPDIQPRLFGLILISPKEHFNAHQLKARQNLKWIPNWLFNCSEIVNRKGLLYSKSVNQFLGSEADEDIRRNQLKWNIQSKTPVYKRFLSGAKLPNARFTHN